MEGIKAYDNQLGDLTDKITTNYDELDFTTTGLKKLTYRVVDEVVILEHLPLKLI